MESQIEGIGSEGSRRLGALLVDPRVRTLAGLGDFPDGAAHLVGGCVRDALLGRRLIDLDLTVAADAESMARALAGARSCPWVRLGRKRFAAYRVVDPNGWIDLWDREGGSLEQDLWRRDLSANALALSLRGDALFDPTGGIADLHARRLRATRPEVFFEDPIRVLRLARLALALPEFAVDPSTRSAARSAAPLLEGMPRERAREELDKLVAGSSAGDALRWLRELEIFPAHFGNRGAGRSGAESIRGGGFDLDRPCSELAFLAAVPDPTESELRLAAHWAGLAAALSGPIRAVASLVEARRDGLLSREVEERGAALLEPAWDPPATAVATRLWLHHAGRSWTAAATLRAAASDGVEIGRRWRELIVEVRDWPSEELERVLEPALLLDGNDVQRRLGIAPGPAVGRVLEGLRTAQVEGSVRTAAEAERWIDEFANRRDRSD